MTFDVLRSRLRRLVAAVGGERGDGPSSAAILAAPVMALAMLLISVGFYHSSRDALTTAAEVATQTASARGASAADGEAAAQAYLAKALPKGMKSTNISVVDGDTVTATVTGEWDSLLPGLTFPPIEGRSSSPRERMTVP